MKNNDLMKNAAPVMLALIVTVGFFFCIYRTSSVAIPEANRDVYNVMIGVLGTVWVKAMSFFYDSSASSKAKDDALGEIAKSAGTGSGIGERSTDGGISAKDVNVVADGDVSVTGKGNRDAI